jgi:hypothetical protein
MMTHFSQFFSFMAVLKWEWRVSVSRRPVRSDWLDINKSVDILPFGAASVAVDFLGGGAAIDFDGAAGDVLGAAVRASDTLVLQVLLALFFSHDLSPDSDAGFWEPTPATSYA